MKRLFFLIFLTPAVFSCSRNAEKKLLPPDAQPANAFTLKDKKVIVYSTADSTQLRLTLTDTLQFADMPQPLEAQSCVFVDPGKKYETFLGIGGALTDASAEVYASLAPAKQDELMQAYFDTIKGIGYSLARTNIHSCDFSSGSYTYADSGDTDLKSFSVAHDQQYRIPFIKKAMQTTGGKLLLFASPWSPPSWMKDNHNMLHGGKLLPAYYKTWADYFVKFIKAYQQQGIPVWGITIQNEPMAPQIWESCVYTAEEERDFLKNYLGPAMVKASLADVRIIVWDHNRNLLYQRASVLLDDAEAAKYAWGVVFHWYLYWMNSDQMHDNVRKVKDKYPDKNLLLTEACNAPYDKNKINDWKWGERYGKAIINDLNAGAVGWTDWNILLDEKGGPNHVNNFCYAPVHADSTRGNLIYTSAYYYIGHLSKFIRPGARRIIAAPTRSNLLATAFINEDGKTVVVVMNQSSVKIPYFLWIQGKAVQVNGLPHSIQTLLF